MSDSRQMGNGWLYHCYHGNTVGTWIDRWGEFERMTQKAGALPAVRIYRSRIMAFSSQSGNLTHFMQSPQTLWGSSDLSTNRNPCLAKKSGL